MAKSTGAATDQTPTATAPAEPVAVPAEPAQKSAIEQELNELKGKLTDYEQAQARLLKDKNEALAERIRYESMYKGLQNQTTRTLQQAAVDRKALEQALKDRAQLADMQTTLETLANRVLDEDERKELSYKQRETKLKLAEQAESVAYSAPEEPTPAVASSQEAALEFDKAQFVNFY